MAFNTYTFTLLQIFDEPIVLQKHRLFHTVLSIPYLFVIRRPIAHLPSVRSVAASHTGAFALLLNHHNLHDYNQRKDGEKCNHNHEAHAGALLLVPRHPFRAALAAGQTLDAGAGNRATDGRGRWAAARPGRTGQREHCAVCRGARTGVSKRECATSNVWQRIRVYLNHLDNSANKWIFKYYIFWTTSYKVKCKSILYVGGLTDRGDVVIL